jgi:tRNA nucleotidyltransferase/poly(A) polymerase
VKKGAQPVAAWPTLSDLARLAAAALRPGEDGWLVGGVVRDAVLGRDPVDADLVVRGDVGRVATALADALKAAVFSYSERFATYRIAFAADRHIDVAPLRGASILDDLRARDFTVNAMALSVRGPWVATGERGVPATASVVASNMSRSAGGSIGPSSAAIVDPLGGLVDLRAGRLRLCSRDGLSADPVRVLRLARFACDLDLTPVPGLEQAARVAAGGLTAISGERVEHELSALLAGRQRVPALRLLDDCGGLAEVLPEVTALKGVTQNRFHHLDVFEHTLEALDYVPGIVAQLEGGPWLTPPVELDMPALAPLVPLAYAVLLHDLGKPAARRVDADGRVMFWYHDAIGAQLAAAICRRLKMSRRFEQFIVLLVRQHLRLGFLVREQPLTQRAVARYRRDVEPYVFDAVALSLADRLATRGENTSAVAIARHIRLARNVWSVIAKAPSPPLLNGTDVMRLLGIGQGRDVGAALAAVRDEAEAGELHDKAEAEAWLRDWWRRLQTQSVEAGEPDRGASDGGARSSASDSGVTATVSTSGPPVNGDVAETGGEDVSGGGRLA